MGVDSAGRSADALGARGMGGAKDVARVLNFRRSSAAQKAKDKGLGVEREGLDRARLVNDTIRSSEALHPGANERGHHGGRGRRGGTRPPGRPRARTRARWPGRPRALRAPCQGMESGAKGGTPRHSRTAPDAVGVLVRLSPEERTRARQARRRRQGVGRPLPHRERTGARVERPGAAGPPARAARGGLPHRAALGRRERVGPGGGFHRAPARGDRRGAGQAWPGSPTRWSASPGPRATTGRPRRDRQDHPGDLGRGPGALPVRAGPGQRALRPARRGRRRRRPHPGRRTAQRGRGPRALPAARRAPRPVQPPDPRRGEDAHRGAGRRRDR